MQDTPISQAPEETTQPTPDTPARKPKRTWLVLLVVLGAVLVGVSAYFASQYAEIDPEALPSAVPVPQAAGEAVTSLPKKQAAPVEEGAAGEAATSAQQEPAPAAPPASGTAAPDASGSAGSSGSGSAGSSGSSSAGTGSLGAPSATTSVPSVVPVPASGPRYDALKADLNKTMGKWNLGDNPRVPLLSIATLPDKTKILIVNLLINDVVTLDGLRLGALADVWRVLPPCFGEIDDIVGVGVNLYYPQLDKVGNGSLQRAGSFAMARETYVSIDRAKFKTADLPQYGNWTWNMASE